MRLSEFAPDHNDGNGHHERPMPWADVVKHAVHWFAKHGFKAKHAPGESAIQFSKELNDYEDEQTWLMAMIGNHDGQIRYMYGSITNGEMDTPLDDYQGLAPMTAHGLNHALLLAEEAFGL